MRPLSLNAVDLRRKLDAMPSHGFMHFLLETLARWSNDASRFGAAIAFHAALALLGSAVLGFAVIGTLPSSDALTRLVLMTQESIGRAAGEALQLLVQRASRHSVALPTAALAFIAVVIGAAGTIVQLRRTFTAVSGTSLLPSLHACKARQRATGMVLAGAMGLAMLASVAMSAVLTTLGDHLPNRHMGSAPALALLDLMFAWAMLSTAFGAMFRWLPDEPLHSRPAWTAGTLGAAGLALGTFFSGRYFAHADLTSAQDLLQAAIVGMLGVYVAAQMTLFAVTLAVKLDEADISRALSSPALPVAVANPDASRASLAAHQAQGTAPISLAAWRTRPGPPIAKGMSKRLPLASGTCSRPAVVLRFPSGKKITR